LELQTSQSPLLSQPAQLLLLPLLLQQLLPMQSPEEQLADDVQELPSVFLVMQLPELR
jgi:hypothetical protein